MWYRHGNVQRLSKIPMAVPTVMANKINLYEAWFVLIPIRKSAYRDLILKQGPGLRVTSALELIPLSLFGKQPVYRCSADPEKLLPYSIRDLDFSKSLRSPLVP